MYNKISSTMGTIITGAVTVLGGLYLGERRMTLSKYETQMKHQHEMELADKTHNHTIEIIKYKYDREEELMKIKSALTSTDSTGPVTKALSELHNITTESPSYDSIPSVFEYILLPTTPSQFFGIGLFMFNLTIFICVIGLIVNYYIKLYGEQYMEKFPKWSLPIVRNYLKLGLLTNYYYIGMIMLSLLFSTITSILIYFRNYFY